MGQFESRPETPDEWAGLPAEPRDVTHVSDLSADVAAADALTLDLGSHLGSIIVPVAPVIEDGAQVAPSEG